MLLVGKANGLGPCKAGEANFPPLLVNINTNSSHDHLSNKPIFLCTELLGHPANKKAIK
jgi:hypothetical protein